MKERCAEMIKTENLRQIAYSDYSKEIVPVMWDDWWDDLILEHIIGCEFWNYWQEYGEKWRIC